MIAVIASAGILDANHSREVVSLPGTFEQDHRAAAIALFHSHVR
jgi:hypothetical protein